MRQGKLTNREFKELIDSQLEQVRRLWNDDRTHAAIASEFGLSKTYVKQLRHEGARKYAPGSPPGTRPSRASKASLQALLAQLGEDTAIDGLDAAGVQQMIAVCHAAKRHRPAVIKRSKQTLADLNARQAHRELPIYRPTEQEIADGLSPGGGYSRETLASWGVSWPPPKGWKKALLT
jgi:hypothetical protein